MVPSRSTSTSISKQIRNVKRVLALKDIPADRRVELERKLDVLIQNSEEIKFTKMKSEKEKRHMERYRMIRFFEKKKATKKLISLVKSNAATEQIEKVKLELNYVVHFPKDHSYIALYPSNTSSLTRRESEKRNRIMNSIKDSISNDITIDASTTILTKYGIIN